MTYTSLSRKINQTDTLIAKFEDGVIARVEGAMSASFRAMDKELRRKWVDGESKDLAGKDRAILLLAEIKDYLSLLPGDAGEIEDLYKALIADAADAGIDFGAAAIDSIAGDGPGFATAKTVRPNIKAVAYQAQDAAKRLYRHDADFQLRASKIIEQGLVQGSGVARVASALRREMGVMAAKAETIARTETMSAMDSAARDTYRQNGIEYVQRIGTQDRLICPFCAARAGNVYEIDKAPSSLHPRDRCYNAPWRKQWADMGLVDEAWLQKHKSDIVARLAEQGKKPDYGLAPFERLNGMIVPPEVIWSVGDAALVADVKLAEVKLNDFPATLDELKTIKPLGGSTGALLVEDAQGNRFVRKSGASAAHLLEESLADTLYSQMGVAVPEHRIYTDADGNPVKLARFIKGKPYGELTGDARRKASVALQKDFAIDALVGNWDVLGLSGDNVIVDADGKPWRIDNGGALRYRAMGALKKDAWNKYPQELWTLRDRAKNSTESPNAFSGLDWFELVDQIDAIKLPQFSENDEVGAMLQERLAEMQRTAKTSKTMQSDKWRSSYVESFTKHGMGYRAAGIIDLLADSMEIQSIYYESNGSQINAPVDQDGIPYDNIRGGEVRDRIIKYYKDAGLDYGVQEKYRNQQGGSSWSKAPLALKSLWSNSRSIDRSQYYWGEDPSDADSSRSELISKNSKWEESMIAMHAWTYEQLSKVDMPMIDRSTGTVKLWRTEGSYIQSHGINLKKTSTVEKGYPRGVAESYSLHTPISAVAGSIPTIQSVPIHRIFADYMLQQRGQESGFLSDRENEVVAMTEGLDIKITPRAKLGHNKNKMPDSGIKYNPSVGVVTTPTNEALDHDLIDLLELLGI